VVDHLCAIFNALLDDVCLVTLRSGPFAQIEFLFLAMLLLHRGLRLIKSMWKLYRDGLYQRLSHRCEVF
jgi:hypothetical protein